VKTIQIDADVYNYILSKAAAAGESLSLVLRRELHLPQPTETIEVDDDIYSYLLSKAESFGESASDILRRKLNVDHQEPHHDGAHTIVFHIPAGTGTQAWNTRDHAIVANVGDTLQIVNDDSAPHRLHTSGDPFPHQSADIAPGQTADFVLQTAFDPGTNHPLYDHNAGPSAQFWIYVRPQQ
jgi:negative regulator of replication initiation